LVVVNSFCFQIVDFLDIDTNYLVKKNITIEKQ
jgi:hypothetical protein